MMIQAKIIKNILKKQGNYYLLTSGSSMLPTIKSNEKVEVTYCEDYKVGDIILFEMCNELILHRIVEIYFPYYVTKGDNHLYSDHYIKYGQIIGKLNIENKDNIKISQYSRKFDGLTFCYWGIDELSNKTLFQLNSYGINIKKETIIKDKINLAIIPGAEKNLDTFNLLVNKYGCLNIIVHFNAKISNSPREGYLELKNFDDYFRIGNRVSNFLLNCEESMLIMLGTLL